MDDGVDYMHPDLIDNYVSKKFNPIKNNLINFYLKNSIKRHHMIFHQMIRIHILVIQMIGLIVMVPDVLEKL